MSGINALLTVGCGRDLILGTLMPEAGGKTRGKDPPTAFLPWSFPDDRELAPDRLARGAIG